MYIDEETTSVVDIRPASHGDLAIYYLRFTIDYFYGFSTKSDGSAEQKSEIWKYFLFHTIQGLTAIKVSTIS